MKGVYQLTRPALVWQLLMVIVVLIPHSLRLPCSGNAPHGGSWVWVGRRLGSGVTR